MSLYFRWQHRVTSGLRGEKVGGYLNMLKRYGNCARYLVCYRVGNGSEPKSVQCPLRALDVIVADPMAVNGLLLTRASRLVLRLPVAYIRKTSADLAPREAVL